MSCFHLEMTFNALLGEVPFVNGLLLNLKCGAPNKRENKWGGRASLTPGDYKRLIQRWLSFKWASFLVQRCTQIGSLSSSLRNS
jgi:hypothetical protein